MRRKRVATTRLAGFESGSISNAVENLLYRHLSVDPYPLTPEETLSLWTAGMPPKEFLAWKAMQEWLTEEKANIAHLPIQQMAAQAVLFRLIDGAKLCLEIPSDMIEFPMWQRDASVFIKPEAVLSPDKAKAFEAWVRRDVHTRYLVIRSKLQLSYVIKLANTAGQLARMAPELVRYTSQLTQTAMQAQERQSALPDEWMQIDRQGLQQALDHLGLCYLIPEKEGNGRDIHAWTRGLIQTYCSYQARPAGPLIAQLFNYGIPPSTVGLGNLGQFAFATQ